MELRVQYPDSWKRQSQRGFQFRNGRFREMFHLRNLEITVAALPANLSRRCSPVLQVMTKPKQIRRPSRPSSSDGLQSDDKERRSSSRNGVNPQSAIPGVPDLFTLLPLSLKLPVGLGLQLSGAAESEKVPPAQSTAGKEGQASAPPPSGDSTTTDTQSSSVSYGDLAFGLHLSSVTPASQPDYPQQTLPFKNRFKPAAGGRCNRSGSRAHCGHIRSRPNSCPCCDGSGTKRPVRFRQKHARHIRRIFDPSGNPGRRPRRRWLRGGHQSQCTGIAAHARPDRQRACCQRDSCD